MQGTDVLSCPKCGSENLHKFEEHTSTSHIFRSMQQATTAAYRCHCGMAFVISEPQENRHDPESVLP